MSANPTDRREQLLDAAIAAIEEHGPHALTGQIAERAGLARPHVYRHFASKEELDLAVARRVHRELTSTIRARLNVGGTPLDIIRAPIASHVTWAEQHPNLYRFLVHREYRRSAQQPRIGGSAFASEVASAGARYIPRFGEDPDAADATIVAMQGIVDASVQWWLLHRGASREELIDRLTNQLWLILDDRLREVGVHLDANAPLPS